MTQLAEQPRTENHRSGLEEMKELLSSEADIAEYRRAVSTQTRDEWFELSRSLGDSGVARAEENQIISNVWDRCESEAYRASFSHWEGSEWFDSAKWRSIGVGTVAKLERMLPMSSGHFQKKWRSQQLNMLEWGPGGGSNLLALQPYSASQYAVDISEKNLRECMRHLTTRLVPFSGMVLKGAPEEILGSVSEPLDLFISTAVFQHFPSKTYGVEVLAVLHQLLTEGGLGYVQIRYDNGNPIYLPKSIGDYGSSLGHCCATSYPIDFFALILEKVGFEVLNITIEDARINYAGFVFQKTARSSAR